MLISRFVLLALALVLFYSMFPNIQDLYRSEINNRINEMHYESSRICKTPPFASKSSIPSLRTPASQQNLPRSLISD